MALSPGHMTEGTEPHLVDAPVASAAARVKPPLKPF
jgi:hypothetical protein